MRLKALACDGRPVRARLYERSADSKYRGPLAHDGSNERGHIGATPRRS